MSQAPISRAVPPEIQATAARNAAADRAGLETTPKPRSFARGVVVGLAIVIPFWLAVVALLYWNS